MLLLSGIAAGLDGEADDAPEEPVGIDRESGGCGVAFPWVLQHSAAQILGFAPLKRVSGYSPNHFRTGRFRPFIASHSVRRLRRVSLVLQYRDAANKADRAAEAIELAEMDEIHGDEEPPPSGGPVISVRSPWASSSCRAGT